MSVRENSLRIYDTKRTFFSKIGSTFSKIFEPTREGINNLIINSKRNNVLKGFKACQNVKEQKKEIADRNFEMYYSFRKLLYTIFLLKSRIIFQQKLLLISDQL